MEEELNAVSSQAAEGQAPETASEQDVAAKEEAGRQFVTLEDLKKLEEKLERRTQSLTAKAESRLAKQINQQLESLNQIIEIQRKAGIELSPEQIRAAKQQIYDEAYSKLAGLDAEPVPQKGSPTSAAGGQDEAIQQAIATFVNQAAEAIFEEFGVVVEEGDPEAKMVDSSDPKAFLKTLRKAADEKAKRVKTPPEARIPTLGHGQPTDLEAQYRRELDKVPNGDVNALIQLERKYRKLGLRI